MEQRLRKMLGNRPGVRFALRRSYQRAMYLFSKKVKSEGALRRATPADGGEWFFGYYDKSPWDLSGKRFLALRAALGRDVQDGSIRAGRRLLQPA